MRPPLRDGARVCERRREKRADGPKNLAAETPELALPPSTSAAMPGTFFDPFLVKTELPLLLGNGHSVDTDNRRFIVLAHAARRRADAIS